jgi:hypothetical protein
MRIPAVIILCLTLSARAAEPPTAAFAGFTLINSSLEPTTEAEKARLAMIDGELWALLEKSGRYRIVSLPPEAAASAKTHPDVGSCGGCQLAWGRQAGTDLVLWGTVQKVSNLILNINVYLDDVKTGHKVLGTSVDIRGNTDESWSRGIRYLVENNLLQDWKDTSDQ